MFGFLKRRAQAREAERAEYSRSVNAAVYEKLTAQIAAILKEALAEPGVSGSDATRLTLNAAGLQEGVDMVLIKDANAYGPELETHDRPVQAGAILAHGARNLAHLTQTLEYPKSSGMIRDVLTTSNAATYPGSDMDPFLGEVVGERQRAHDLIDKATEQYERVFDERFSEDVLLKQRLSDFALENELDRALIALWGEIKHYPAWSQEDDFEKWNALKLRGITGTEEDDNASVQFVGEDHQFTVIQRRWDGAGGASYADFSFLEDGDEVFAITCLIEDDALYHTYRCIDVRAFKKRGRWAKVLLDCYTQIQIDCNKSAIEDDYFLADEIRIRFEE